MDENIRIDRERSLAFHGGLTRRAWLRALDRRLGPFGLSPIQFFALGYIIGGAAISQTDLADLFLITRTTAVRLVHRLVRDGLITRESDASDGRVKLLVPTPKAVALWKEISPIGPAMLEQAYSGIDPAEMEVTKRVLARMRENLDS